MPCYHPLDGWRSKKRNESGKRSIVFNRTEGFVDMPVKVPCGQCIGCRLERSRQWAIRCVHESSLYDRNCFVTLTYDNDHLPDDNSLEKHALTKFMKRLRKKYGSEIRFFACGEYGSQLHRPHYHLCLFNHDFNDKEIWSVKNGFKLYRSPSLEKLWPFGYSTIGDVTFESAAYVARYVTKKITGKDADEHYTTINKETGEIVSERLPEFVRMSRRPGIGTDWLNSFTDDIYNHDYVIINGKKCRPPKFYDTRFEIEHPDEFLRIKGRRKKNILTDKYEMDNTTDRLKVKKTIQNRKHQLLIRSYENENLCSV